MSHQLVKSSKLFQVKNFFIDFFYFLISLITEYKKNYVINLFLYLKQVKINFFKHFISFSELSKSNLKETVEKYFFFKSQKTVMLTFYL